MGNRLSKIYTRTGDDGSTGLGGGQRVPKDSERITAYGTVDETNSVIGCALAAGVAKPLDEMLTTIQNELFNLGSDLCVLEEDKQRFNVPQIEPRHVERLEKFIDKLQEELKPLENFILPGGTMAAAQLHVARCVCRRAERDILRLSRKEKIGPFALKYINRLSDLLFVMSRYENLKRKTPDVLWNMKT
jgi:cob(I)alamin adenosyltransferase